ncbi:MAG: folylpolyglutamate synthase/dihydrofolate synthase family protein [Candidatus Andersenbacteria bacterium]
MPQAAPLNEQLAYIYDLERFGIKLGLEVMTKLCAILGNPQTSFPSVHITGTNGKGSTASFLESTLRAAGYKVGLYTSPHLYQFNERIRVDGQAITDEALIALIAHVRSQIAAYDLTITFFEFTTALTFLQFARARVDIAIIEVGMGGALDATNVITPLVAVITNIGLDHVPEIGEDKAAIAANKAGIIKRGQPVVTAETQPALLQYFAGVCQQQQAPFYSVGEHLTVKESHASLAGQTFTTTGTITDTFFIKLLGQHQITNACTALLTLHLLRDQGFVLTPTHLTRGLSQAVWEGRLDIVSRKPFILVDGAHNNDGVQALAAFLKTMPLPHPDVLIVAQKKGKQLGLETDIAPLFDQVIVTQGSYEPEDTSVVARALRAHHPHVQEIPALAHALAVGRKLIKPDSMMLITGSLYMVGDALSLLRATPAVRK